MSRSELGGTQLPNGDLLVYGFSRFERRSYSIMFYHYQAESNKWRKIEPLWGVSRSGHSSVFIDGQMFSMGGDQTTNACYAPEDYRSTHHEAFSIEGRVKQRKKMPIGIAFHTATIFGENRMLISGGSIKQVSKIS